MAPSRTDSALILDVPCTEGWQRTPSPHDGAFSAQGPAPSKTLCPPVNTPLPSRIPIRRLCVVRHAPVGRPRCIKAPSVPKGGALDMIQFPSLKYAIDHVAGIMAPLRGNGRAPTESEKHLYRIVSSECIANSMKVLWKALWMHMVMRCRLWLEGRSSGLKKYIEGRLYAVCEGASSVETLPSVTRFF